LTPGGGHGRIRQWVLVAGFLAGVGVPLLGTVFRWGTSRGFFEKRALAGPPEVSLFWRKPTRFFGQLKDFFSDGFGFRAPLVRFHSGFMVWCMRVSPTPWVVLGKGGWLYFTGDQSMEEYTCVAPFSPGQLDQWQTLLERRRDWLAARGIGYVFTVAPNAQTIYPEYLPDSIRRAGGATRLDQLLARLEASPHPVTVVDLRPALWAAKARERLYCKTDTHWNDRGALAGARELLAALKPRLPGLALPERDQFHPSEEVRAGGDLALFMDLSTVMPETWLNLDPPANSDLQWQRDPLQRIMHTTTRHLPDRGPSLVMFHDSFGFAMQPFLSQAFGRAFYLNCGPYFEPTLVESARPAVVVQEIVERTLMTDPAPYLQMVP